LALHADGIADGFADLTFSADGIAEFLVAAHRKEFTGRTACFALRRSEIDALAAVSLSASSAKGKPRKAGLAGSVETTLRTASFAVDVCASFLTTQGETLCALDASGIALNGARVFLADRITVAISLDTSVDAERAKSALSIRTAECVRRAESRTACSTVDISNSTLKKQAYRVITADGVVLLRDIASNSGAIDHAVRACVFNFRGQVLSDHRSENIRHDALCFL